MKLWFLGSFRIFLCCEVLGFWNHLQHFSKHQFLTYLLVFIYPWILELLSSFLWNSRFWLHFATVSQRFDVKPILRVYMKPLNLGWVSGVLWNVRFWYNFASLLQIINLWPDLLDFMEPSSLILFIYILWNMQLLWFCVIFY